MKQKKEDFEKHLVDQVDFLHRSCQAFDQGFESEAKRLATTIRVLLHTTKNQTSLLSLLDHQNICFYDPVGPIIQANLLSENTLVFARVSPSKTSQYLPHLDDRQYGGNKWLPFEQWWTMTVCRDSLHKLFSRRRFILEMANTDGGAHVDPKLNKAYANLSRFNSMGWIVEIGGTEHNLRNLVFASVRQIAHEVIHSLEVGCKDILGPFQQRKT